MAIKFVCSCGKHLRARDEMAARRSVCPRCGAPVGIPARQPTQPGTPLGPMTPTERVGRRPVVASAEAVFREASLACPASSAPPVPAESATGQAPEPPARVAPPRKPRTPSGRQSLVYVLRALPLILGLALVLTVLTAAAASVPELRDVRTAASGWILAILCAPFVL